MLTAKKERGKPVKEADIDWLERQENNITSCGEEVSKGV